jgi:hypothetical protein
MGLSGSRDDIIEDLRAFNRHEDLFYLLEIRILAELYPHILPTCFVQHEVRHIDVTCVIHFYNVTSYT